MRAGSLLAAFSCGQQTSDFIEWSGIGQTQVVTLCCDEILPVPFSATSAVILRHLGDLGFSLRTQNP